LLSATPPKTRDENQMRLFYRGLLEQAYQDFVSSTPLQEKVFAVFQRPVEAKKPAAATVAIEDLRSSLRGKPVGSAATAAEGNGLPQGGTSA
ncbi:MAG: nitrogenase-stabilizing/protective protein NifW, partial [Methylacidiphilaceae bacterium]|nr:nitrogenase-stabilizing/protective protein NifW [Candidatus Methylacidiphilaceae bacterium]